MAGRSKVIELHYRPLYIVLETLAVLAKAGSEIHNRPRDNGYKSHIGCS